MRIKIWPLAHVTVFVVLFALVFGLALACSNPKMLAAQEPEPKLEGGAYTSWWHGEYSSANSDQTLAKIQDTGTEWISLLATWYQDTLTSTTIYSDANRTPTDADVIHAIETAHTLGLKVMLKPHLDVQTGEWRGYIGEGVFTTEAQWDAWFESYQAFINHYAQIAADHDVEMFCVGTELDKTAVEEMRWRGVITGTSGVGSIYEGPLVYAANHTYTNTVMFWDALDYIGIDAYYALATTTTATLEDFKTGWVSPTAFLEELADEWDMSILFTEVGYRSIDGAGMAPWAYEGNPPLDLQEQADLYQALFETVYQEPWFAGVFWWNWTTNPMQGGPCDRNYTPLDKPAEIVLREYFGGEPKETGGGLNPRPDTTKTRDIYIDNELAHAEDWSWGWWDGTWHGGTIVYTATDEVYAGESSIRADLIGQDWDAAQFGGWGDQLNTAYNYGLEFYIKQENLDHGLQILFSDGGNTLDYCRYTVEVVDGWSHVRIPFVEANWLDKDLSLVNFAFQTMGNDTTFWLDNMRVLGAIPVELDDGYEQSAKAGETVTYTHALKNYDDETASFALSADSSRNWPLELLIGDPGSTYQGPFPLEAGMTTTVQIVLTIPLTETAGVTDTTTLVANGVDTIVMYSDSLEDITTVLPTTRFIYLPLVMRNF
ncbi:MAG: glycoside hydrolase family 113 [Anaerolineae bacterium]